MRSAIPLLLAALAGLARAGVPETVVVGNAGNRADSTGYGAVAYTYRIGTYEVTNAEYVEFLSAVAKTDPHGLYNPGMAGEYGGILRRGRPGRYTYAVKPGWGRKPVNFVSWYDALRYANWLTNGRGSGSTETGAYRFTRTQGRWKVQTPDHAALAGGKAVTWVLAGENEWYKAAYYDPDKPGGAGYWPYATRSRKAPSATWPPGTAPAANCGLSAVTNVGAYTGSASAYGTFDQNGGMWEWNETRSGGKCGVRGGSFYLNDRAAYLRSATRYVSNPPTFEFSNYGFRVVALGGGTGGGTAVARRPTPTGPPSAGGSTPGKTSPPTKIGKVVDTPKPPRDPARTKPRIFYVSQSLGNDDWTGEFASPLRKRGPWKTLARASVAYLPGDRILLRRGDTWNDELRPRGQGTPEKPILIGSYGNGDKPVIDRQDYNKDRVGIRLVDQGGFKITGLEFTRCMTGIYAEYSDGCPTKRSIRIEDCYFHDSLKYGNYKTYPRPRNIGLGICFFSWERDKRVVLKDITVKNCVFRRLASGVWTNSPDNFNKNASYVYNFANLVFEDCLFEEGYQWQMGIRGVDGGLVRNCVTHDIGRGFRAWNGVAGAMFFRCKNWLFEDSEWGFVSIGLGSGDGEAFDFEGNCDHMTMRRCLFHDTDGPGFLLCCYASDGHPNTGIVMENCVLNGKAKRPIGLPRCEIVNTTDWTEATWRKCRFYLSKGEVLMRVMDPEKDKRSSFVDCRVKNLADACRSTNLAPRAKATASSQTAGHEAAKGIDGSTPTFWQASSEKEAWLQIEFARPTFVNEFKIREHPSSHVERYVMEYWDDRADRWVSCFNGAKIGTEFVAPIVSRPVGKVRLRILRTQKGPAGICEFEAYNDPTGKIVNIAPTPRRK